MNRAIKLPPDILRLMLEQIFSSKTRVKMLRLFLVSDERPAYYVREITRKIGEHIHSVRKELENLMDFGLVVEAEDPDGKESRRKYYRAKRDFVLYPELRALIFKSQLLLEKSLAEKMKEIGKVDYLALTGLFTGNDRSSTDVLVVGSVSRIRLAKLMGELENALGRSVNYTLMDLEEYRDRRGLTDRFLFDILENERIELINGLA